MKIFLCYLKLQQSVGDLIPRMGSFNSQYFAIKRYEGFKEGLNEEEIVHRLAFGDAI